MGDSWVEQSMVKRIGRTREHSWQHKVRSPLGSKQSPTTWPERSYNAWRFRMPPLGNELDLGRAREDAAHSAL
jgi:hypothetical protein